MVTNTGIFKPYDIRGVYPDEINPEIVRGIARAVVRFLGAKKLVVGQGVRTSSDALRPAVIDGITSAGCDVLYIGQASSPLFYFAVNSLGVDGGIMITASHNPPEYNGLKIVRQNSVPVGLDSGLGEIRKLIYDSQLSDVERGDLLERSRMVDEYVDFLIKTSGLDGQKIKTKVAVDASGGAASFVVSPVFEKLGIDHNLIFGTVDGTFVNHSPNPLTPGSLDELILTVKKEKADCGIAFDADGDRIILINEKGEKVDPQYVLALLWQKNKGNVVYDSRFSRSVKNMFGSSGVMSRVGYTYIINNMLNSSALIGGETSGHFYYKEMMNRESTVLTALKIIEVLNSSKKPLSELVKDMEKYSYSGEINIDYTGDFEELREKLKQEYSDAKLSELDGLTVEYKEWWFNIRPSNTESKVRIVVEAENDSELKSKVEDIRVKVV